MKAFSSTRCFSFLCVVRGLSPPARSFSASHEKESEEQEKNGGEGDADANAYFGARREAA